MTDITLYDYWRSSASYRVRIALNLKGLPYTKVLVNLLTADHQAPAHLKRNPQGLVPAIDIDGKTFTQSLAIIEYLEEAVSEVPLLPSDPQERARVRAMSYAIAMEIHPICNLNVVNHVCELTGGDDETKKAWMQHFIHKGLAGFEAYLNDPMTGKFCHGDEPGMADCCLVPQIYNAERWGVDYSEFGSICRIVETCSQLAAFSDAYPRQ